MANKNPSPSTRFRQGVSGNPGGRTKKLPFTDTLRKLAEEKDAEAALARVVLREALKGDIRFIAFIYDRIEGRPLSRVEVNETPETASEYIVRILQESQAEPDAETVPTSKPKSAGRKSGKAKPGNPPK